MPRRHHRAGAGNYCARSLAAVKHINLDWLLWQVHISETSDHRKQVRSDFARSNGEALDCEQRERPVPSYGFVLFVQLGERRPLPGRSPPRHQRHIREPAGVEPHGHRRRGRLRLGRASATHAKEKLPSFSRKQPLAGQKQQEILLFEQDAEQGATAHTLRLRSGGSEKVQLGAGGGTHRSRMGGRGRASNCAFSRGVGPLTSTKVSRARAHNM